VGSSHLRLGDEHEDRAGERIEMRAAARRQGASFTATVRAIDVFAIMSSAMLAVVCGFLLGQGQVLPVAGAATVVVAAFIAYRWPVVAAMAVLLISGGYSIFAMTPGWDIKGTTLWGGVRLEDAFMVGMLVAGLLRGATPQGRERLGKRLAPAILLGAWLARETLRNGGSVGLSAPGDLRFYYLLLAVAFCLVASLDRDDRVLSALKGFVLIAVALPVALLPVVVAMKGWSFGPSARVFPSQVSLGLVLGLAVLWQAPDLVRWPRWSVYVVTLLGALVILLDAERSVWLAAVVILGVLLVRQSIETRVRWALLGLLLVAAVTVSAQGLGYDVVSIVVERGRAGLTLQDTTGLRLSMWKAAWPLVVDSPIIGRGLGMPWDLYLADLGYSVRVYPHSLYVMVLVNLGVVGLLLCAWTWARATRILLTVPGSAEPAEAGDAQRRTYATLGLAAVGAIAAYGVAYGFEIYSVTLAGICLSGAMLAPTGRSERSRGMVE
jgi:hypothetical protein